MSRVLPILFNTDMVRAILEGRKTVTRRLIKPQPKEGHYTYVYCHGNCHIKTETGIIKPPYQPGNILYIRETWERFDCCSCEGDEHGNCPKEPKKSVLDKYGCGCYMYRASDEIWGDAKWHPSIHMPKEAARIWLKVKDVRVERLKNITEEQAEKEGFQAGSYEVKGTVWGQEDTEEWTAVEEFGELWNYTIKKSDLDRYGWDASPWVWVIEFERCEKPEGWCKNE